MKQLSAEFIAYLILGILLYSGIWVWNKFRNKNPELSKKVQKGSKVVQYVMLGGAMGFGIGFFPVLLIFEDLDFTMNSAIVLSCVGAFIGLFYAKKKMA